MKTTIAACLASAALAAFLSFQFTHAAMYQPPQPQVETLPVEYQNGFSFNTPCPEHGTDTNVVTGSRLMRAYEISVDGEVQGEATGESIAQVLEMMKLMGVPQPNDTQESR